MINRLLWALPHWAHHLIYRAIGWRLVNYHSVTADGMQPALLRWEKWT